MRDLIKRARKRVFTLKRENREGSRRDILRGTESHGGEYLPIVCSFVEDMREMSVVFMRALLLHLVVAGPI